MTKAENGLRDWSTLSSDEQTSIRVEYGYYLDGLPPSCDLDTKLERFRTWLLEFKAVRYDDSGGA